MLDKYLYIKKTKKKYPSTSLTFIYESKRESKLGIALDIVHFPCKGHIVTQGRVLIKEGH